jgi:flagellar biosynthesis/type III secretory pathway protein FliH
MSFALILRSDHPVLRSDSPVLDPEDVQRLPHLKHAIEALEARAAEFEVECMDRREIAHEEGRKEGFARGLKEGRAAALEETLKLETQTLAAQAAMRGSIARLAVAVVKRIAAEIGPPQAVAALAERAAREAAPEQPLTIRVRPECIAAVRARLGALPIAIDYKPDDRLEKNGCVIETQFGAIEAGLDAQLAALEKALASERLSGVR